jgi:hypothetical protein
MATKKNAPVPGGKIIFTEDAIVISLTAAEKRKAQRCLEKSGKITFSVQEHSVTKLPSILDNGKAID